MKKYLIALVAIIVVAAIGIYFGNPELLQGRTSIRKVQGSYVKSKDLCYKYIPPEEVQGNGPAEETEGTIEITPPSTEKTDGVDTNTGTERRGGGSGKEGSESEKPNINIIIPGVGGTTGTVAPGSAGTSGDSGNTPGGGSKKEPSVYPKYLYTEQCSCDQNGETIGESKNEDGSITKTKCWLSPEKCIGGKVEYICPRGEEFDWNKVFNMCHNLKNKICFGAAGPKFDKEGQAFCKIFQSFEMAKSCFPTPECSDLIAWYKEGLSTAEMVKKLMEQGLTQEEALNEVPQGLGSCLEETFVP